MALLKKIKAATLVETLLASGLVLIVFVVGSISLNNVFLGAVSNNDAQLNNRTKELMYLTRNNALVLPFYEENEQWEISIEKNQTNIIISTLHKSSGKEKEVIIEE